MKRQIKKPLCVLVLLLYLCSSSLPAMAAVSTDTLSDLVQQSAEYVMKTVPEPQVSSIGGEWAVIGLARSGADIPQSYWEQYYSRLEQYVKNHKGRLHEKKYTEYSRVILALTAIDKNPANVAGYNLLTPLGDFEKTIQQGINGPVWALIALDSGKYTMPVNKNAKTQASRQLYIDEILSRQLNNGGWSLSAKGGSGAASADITGMVLQALAPYQQQESVKAATEKGVRCLSQMQKSDGGYGDNSESVVQVLVGLCALGIDWNDARFVKQGNTLLDNLLTYRQTDGSFWHMKDGKGDSQMAAEQGLYGMVAALRAAQGNSSLYDMYQPHEIKSADQQAAGAAKTDVLTGLLTQPEHRQAVGCMTSLFCDTICSPIRF